MHELVSAEKIEKAVVFIAILGAILGGGLALVFRKNAKIGIAIAAFFILNLAFWRFSDIVVGRLGLDSAVGTALQLAIPALIGFCGGALLTISKAK